MATFIPDSSQTIILAHDFSQDVPGTSPRVDHENGTVDNKRNAVRAEIFNQYEKNLKDITERIGNVDFANASNELITIGSKIRLIDQQIAQFASSNVTIQNISDITGIGVMDLRAGFLNCYITGTNITGYIPVFSPGTAIAQNYYFTATGDNTLEAIDVDDIYSSYTQIDTNIVGAEIYTFTGDPVNNYYTLSLPYLVTKCMNGNTSSICVETLGANDSQTGTKVWDTDGTNVIIDNSETGVIRVHSSLVNVNKKIAIAYQRYQQYEKLIYNGKLDEDDDPAITFSTPINATRIAYNTPTFKYADKYDYYVKHATDVETEIVPLYIFRVDLTKNYKVDSNGKTYLEITDDNLIDLRKDTFSTYDAIVGIDNSRLSVQDAGACKTRVEAKEVTAISTSVALSNVRRIEITTDDNNKLIKSYNITNSGATITSDTTTYAPIVAKPIAISYFVNTGSATVAEHTLSLTYDNNTLVIYIPSFYSYSSNSRIVFYPVIDGSTYMNKELYYVGKLNSTSEYIGKSQVLAGTGIKSDNIQDGAITSDKIGIEIYKYSATSENVTFQVPFELDGNVVVLCETSASISVAPQSPKFYWNIVNSRTIQAGWNAESAFPATYNVIVIKGNSGILSGDVFFNTIEYYANVLDPANYIINISRCTPDYSSVFGRVLVEDNIYGITTGNLSFSDVVTDFAHIDQIPKSLVYKSMTISGSGEVSLVSLLPVENVLYFIQNTVVLFTDSNNVVRLAQVNRTSNNISVTNANGLTVYLLKVQEQ